MQAVNKNKHKEREGKIWHKTIILVPLINQE